MRRLILYMLLSGIVSHVSGQRQDVIDSLTLKLEQTDEDTSRVHILTTLCWELRDKDPKQALIYAKAGINLAEQLDFKVGQANLYNNIGLIEEEQGNYQVALEYYIKSIAVKDELGDKRGLAQTYNNIGIIHYYMENKEKVLEYFLKSLGIKEEIGDKKGMSYSYNNIGLIYDERGNTEKALEYYLKSLHMKQELNDNKGIANSYANIGNLYMQKGDLDLALSYLQKATTIQEDIGNKYGLVFSLIGIGDILGKQQQYSLAIHKIEQGLAIAAEIGAKEALKTGYGSLTEVYEAKRDYQLAYRYQQLHTTIKDSLLNEKTNKQIAELDTRYQTEKKEKEIQLLTKDQELQQLTLNKQASQRNYLILGALLLLLVAYLLYNRYNIKKKANVILADKNKKITDSITYAKRIQDAILPSSLDMDELLLQHFIFYKPRDIVSGDFYWVSELEQKIVIATVDCTGHGVPGAFMSMIGNTLLNEIVNEKRISRPAEILNHLHKGVLESLQQQSNGANGQQDGMDITVCTFDPGSREMQYATANQSIYRVHEDQIEELEGDYFSIGEQLEDIQLEFTNNSVGLQKGDMLYLFSDGFADQFGREDSLPDGTNKKYTLGRFESLLFDIHRQPLNDQKSALGSALSDWQGATPQVDDILVMGIRV